MRGWTGKISGSRALHCDERLDKPPELRRIVDVRGTMQRHHAIALALEAQAACRIRCLDRRPRKLEAVHHDVADTRHPFGRYALDGEVRVRIGGRRPQHVGEHVGHETVELLGHRPVAAAQACLEMDGRDAELGADERTGGGRVHVADDDQPVGPLSDRHLLVGDHHPAGLLGMAAGTHAEMMVRLRQLQIGEDRVGHVGIVMLAGMGPAPARNRVRPTRRARAARPS